MVSFGSLHSGGTFWGALFGDGLSTENGLVPLAVALCCKL